MAQKKINYRTGVNLSARLVIHLEFAQRDTPSGSCLEACVRLWQLGDYFQVKGMTELAEHCLHSRCNGWRKVSLYVDAISHPTTFLYDVECAIRRAWSEHLNSGPLVRETLAKLCLDFAPYLKHHRSFSTLLEEIPGFMVVFSQQALGNFPSILPLPMPPASHTTQAAMGVGGAGSLAPVPINQLARLA